METIPFEEQAHPDYPPEKRPIPQVDYAVVQQALSAAVVAGTLWLVFGNDSVFKDKPSAIQLDADAVLYRPPKPLASIDFLPLGPSRRPGVRSRNRQTDIEKLYAEMKVLKGRPWPEKVFLDALNAAIAQGFIHRAAGTGPISSLQHDGKSGLIIKAAAPAPTPPSPAGRRRSSMVQLTVSEVQTLGEEIAHLTKLLAGCDPVVETCISVKDKGDMDLKAVEESTEEDQEGLEVITDERNRSGAAGVWAWP